MKRSLCASVVAFSVFVAARAVGAAGDPVWTDAYTLGGRDAEAQAVQTRDGVVVVAGFVRSPSAVLWATLAYDADGLVMWTDTLDLGGHFAFAKSVAMDGEAAYVGGFARDGAITDFGVVVAHDVV